VTLWSRKLRSRTARPLAVVVGAQRGQDVVAGGLMAADPGGDLSPLELAALLGRAGIVPGRMADDREEVGDGAGALALVPPGLDAGKP
jgi:hypothetical protein